MFFRIQIEAQEIEMRARWEMELKSIGDQSGACFLDLEAQPERKTSTGARIKVLVRLPFVYGGPKIDCRYAVAWVQSDLVMHAQRPLGVALVCALLKVRSETAKQFSWVR